MVIVAFYDELRTFKKTLFKRRFFTMGEIAYVFEPRIYLGIKKREWFKILFHMRSVTGSIYGRVCTLGSGKRILLCVGRNEGLVPCFLVTEDAKVYRAFVKVDNEGFVDVLWRDAKVMCSYLNLFAARNPLMS